MKDHKRIANNLKAEIKRKGLTLEYVAFRTGTSRQSFTSRLNRFSKGEDIRFSFFEKTAKVLDISLSKFFEK